MFKTGFGVQNHRLNLCSITLWIHKGYYVVKKLVWNNHIKALTLLIKTVTLLFGILVLSPILMLLFPLLRVLIMVISLVNTGKEWKKFSAFIKVYEGHFESFFQFVLQFYIILTRADREPSNIQLLTVAISLIMVVVSGMNGYFRLIH